MTSGGWSANREIPRGEPIGQNVLSAAVDHLRAIRLKRDRSRKQGNAIAHRSSRHSYTDLSATPVGANEITGCALGSYVSGVAQSGAYGSSVSQTGQALKTVRSQFF
jgi:hypothetical protein